jgi:hypothetical protein
LEPLTSQEVPIQPLFSETSSDKLEVETLKPELISFEIKVDKLPTSRSSGEYIYYPDLTPFGSPEYTPCKSEESNPHFLVPIFSNFLSPETFLLNSEGVERSLHILENPFNNPKVSSLKSSMATARLGGVGGHGAGGGGVGQGPPPPPKFLLR